MMGNRVEVLVVGAGLAGLSCARRLADAEVGVTVLDRSPLLGGRCASKSPGMGFPVVDFGPVFVHGDDPEFISWVSGQGRTTLPGWPQGIRGSGTPCQPQAFDPRQHRWGLPEGIRSLGESLASGLDVVVGAQVVAISRDSEGFETRTLDGRRFLSRDLVLALATEQTRDLVAPLDRGIAALLSSFASLPCLAVLAAYPDTLPRVTWDIWYPESSPSLLLVSNEASKRTPEGSPGNLLLLQARPQWSRERMEAGRAAWEKSLIEDAALLVGPWVLSPLAVRSHRWQYGRLGPSDHLAQPMLFSEGGPGRLGLAGDLFDPDGGLQGAWRSGRKLAQRLLGN